jgi:hypothetical protein
MYITLEKSSSIVTYINSCQNTGENMTNKLLQQIEQVFTQHKLLGNYDFSEGDYSQMLEITGKSCRNFLDRGCDFETKYHRLIFATLVETAKRWKETDTDEARKDNSRFWDYISKFLISETPIKPRLRHSFTNIISQMDGQQTLAVVKAGKCYYATLMMHSFSPKQSIHSFFNLCYNIFKKDLDFGFTSDDEWLCEIVAAQVKNVLSGDYREDKKVSIGSATYSIKIGLRSFALHEDLSDNFVKFIKDTLYQINKLFNRESFEVTTRLEQYIVEWWKNKTESEKVSDNTIRKKRIPIVSKQNIAAKYVRDAREVFLYIPAIRIDDSNSIMYLSVFLNGKQVHSEKMKIKQGELVSTTQPVELELNELLGCNSIDIKVEIKENGNIIFDSNKSETNLLQREFILFEEEKEVLNPINKPTNYFVYSKNIDGLKRRPDELVTYGNNLYNIYPKAGESLIGETKQIFFVDQLKASSLGKTACLIGNLSDIKWILDDMSCTIYNNSVNLMIPKSANLKALELRIDKKPYKLHDLHYERPERNYYQFKLNPLELISESYPTEISLYSYEEEKIILTETLIVFPNLNIQFNHPFYYGNIERKSIISNGNEKQELTWSNHDNEITCPFNEGVLVVKIPYFRWRINNNEWHNEPISKKLWYKSFLRNGDLLEIEKHKENEEIALCGIADGKKFKITKNQSKYEIGRAIYSNEGKTDLIVYFFDGKDYREIFLLSTKEYFLKNPLVYREGNVYWDVENTFIGDKDNEFFLVIQSKDNNLQIQVKNINQEIKNLNEDNCKVQVKIKDKNIFSEPDTYQLIFEGNLLIGSPEKLRFKNKIIKLLRANCFNNKSEWIPFFPKYFIEKLKIVREDENIYYSGRLCVINQNGKTQMVNTMKDEKGEYVTINPVRIELRDNSTLWLVAGWKGGNDFVGNLFFDKWSNGICNIQKSDIQYDEINLYKFKEEEDV